MSETYTLRVYRGHPGKQYFEEFKCTLNPFTNVISSLMEIQQNPVNIHGKAVEPIVWEQGCLEEVCGSCSMLVNQKPRQACTALIRNIISETKSNTVTLAPFTKFPLVRDLIVDRTVMFENLKKVNAWIDSDGAYEKGFGPKISPEKQQVMYELSTCMTCGCCSEACPQVNDKTNFVGPAPISQARLFNANPVGKMQKHKRLRPLMEDGGISDCGNSQNCVRVCPKDIPLTDSIAAISRDVTLQSLRDLFKFHDSDE